ncbi:hypothetical protein LUU34_00377400 [Aix galericulata]|nr:hypothetical protein LUU34_00377400 [Aix galericulata]
MEQAPVSCPARRCAACRAVPCRAVPPPARLPERRPGMAGPGGAAAPLVLYHWTQSFSSQKVRREGLKAASICRSRAVRGRRLRAGRGAAG